MKIRNILIVGCLILSGIIHAQPSLSYQRLTNGLAEPDFDEGHTDFAFDDINMDGNIDILTVGDHGSPNFNSAQHGIIVWFGDGAGNFENYMNGNFGYGGIAIGDVNNDGHKDVGYGVHHNYSGTNWGDQLNEVVLGDGTGMNWEVWDEGLSGNGEDWGMFETDFGDVDNDGDLDLVSNSFGSGAGVHVYLNQGDGTWEQSFGFLNGNSDNNVEFGDFNSDGYLDFIASHEFGSVYFGDGTGSFTNNDNGLPTLATFEVRSGISVGDANTDGSADISFVNSSGGIAVYLWDKNTNMSWVSMSGELPQTGSFDFTELVDLNADGLMDITAIENETISFWLGDGLGNWTFETTFSIDPTADGKAFRAGGDFDHNGHPDLVLLAEIGPWYNYQNYMYCFKENDPADSLWIMPQFPTGNENFYPGSVQFIKWASEVPAGENSSVNIEISAFGPQDPWWMLANELPNNGKHQWIVPNFGSNQVFLKFTVNHESGSATSITQAAFNIYGNPTSIEKGDTQGETTVYPNPGSDYIFIRNFEFAQSIIFRDVSGRICFKLNQPNGRIDLKHLSSGIYFYEIITKNGSGKNGKWIKK